MDIPVQATHGDICVYAQATHAALQLNISMKKLEVIHSYKHMLLVRSFELWIVVKIAILMGIVYNLFRERDTW